MGEQARAQVWAGLCSSAEAAGHAPRSGVLRRGPTALRGPLFQAEVLPYCPRPLRGAGGAGTPGSRPSQASAQRPWGAGCCLEGQLPFAPTHTASPGDGASSGQSWGHTCQPYQEGRVGSHLRGSTATPGTLAPGQDWSRDRAGVVSCHTPPRSWTTRTE